MTTAGSDEQQGREAAVSELRDGRWVPAQPLPYFPGLDFEAYADGRWEAYEGGDHVASGRLRFALVRAVQMRLARRRWRSS